MVSDEDGSVIGTSRLRAGSPDPGPDGDWYCVFEFAVEVPLGPAFYEIEVSHRGGLTYSIDEVQRASWFVNLELG